MCTMDAFHQPYMFMRPSPTPPQTPPPPPPPPPPTYAMAESPRNHTHYLHNNAPSRHPVPRQGPWYPGQFQYHPSQSPSPPPPQWAPSPHLDHPPPLPYPSPLHHNSALPYHALPSHNQFPPPHRPLVFPPPSQVPSHPYHSQPQISQPNTQEWSNSNWVHHQGWEYPAHGNEEDWAARARAWAAAKAVMDNQHGQSQFPPTGSHDEQIKYHSPYPQVVDPHYPDFQQRSLPSTSYQQYPGPTKSPSIGSKPSSYDPDGHSTYAFGDGVMTGESSAAFLHQESVSACSSVHPQEVPSSYSSVTGHEETANQNEQLYKSLQPPMASLGRPTLMEPPHFQFGNLSAGSTVDLADQPLDFIPRFNHANDINFQPGYGHSASADIVRGIDPVSTLPSINNWAPTIVPGPAYPSAGPQHDPSMVVPHLVSGQSAPIIGRIAGQSLQPPVPAFGLGAGPALHPSTGFSTDVYGVSTAPERPKKAPVPNWLREEIIKKKPVITSSASEYAKEETETIEDDDAIDLSAVKGGLEDTRSMDSSRSAEEDDDDEDYDEAAKTAAINLEIKRILTEVLLKVTDDLFDEIATKVVSESDLVVEDSSIDVRNDQVYPHPTTAPAPAASAKVIIPVKANESESEDVNEKPSSHSAGNILGLVNYASDDDDDDDDDDDPSSKMHDALDSPVHQQSGVKEFSDANTVENVNLQTEIEEHDGAQANEEADLSRTDALSDNNGTGESKNCNDDSQCSLKSSSEAGKHEINLDGRKVPSSSIFSKSSTEEVAAKEPRTLEEGTNAKSIADTNETHKAEAFARKDIVKQLETGNIADENHRRQDDRHRDGLKEGSNGQDSLHGEKAKEPDSRKRSFELDAKEEKKGIDRHRKYGDREGAYRKRERIRDGEGDRSRREPVNNLKRGHSSFRSSKGVNSNGNSVVSYANDLSDDDTPEDSKRKLNSRRQRISQSPRRRQVSRSPHSKRSQRRHSPYSSLEAARGRRSRSRSPACWRR